MFHDQIGSAVVGYARWHCWIVETVRQITNKDDAKSQHDHLSHPKGTRQNALVCMHARHGNILDPAMNESAVNLLAHIADDILVGDRDRRMLACPRDAVTEMGGRNVITATIGIINRQFRLAKQIDRARLDGVWVE